MLKLSECPASQIKCLLSSSTTGKLFKHEYLSNWFALKTLRGSAWVINRKAASWAAFWTLTTGTFLWPGCQNEQRCKVINLIYWHHCNWEPQLSKYAFFNMVFEILHSFAFKSNHCYWVKTNVAQKVRWDYQHYFCLLNERIFLRN